MPDWLRNWTWRAVAFDGFDCHIVARYDADKLKSLRHDEGIVRNRLKIVAAVSNAKAFMNIQSEFGSFDSFIWSFTNGKVIYECERTSSPLSDTILKGLKKRGRYNAKSLEAYDSLEDGT